MGLIELNLKSTSSQKSYSRDLLEKELERDEGKRDRPYRCSEGYLTIGIGHNLDAKPLSEAAIRQIFYDDIEDVERELDREMPWWRKMSDARQRAMINMAFNMGVAALADTPTFKLIEMGKYAQAAERLKGWKWYKQVGQRAYRVCKMWRDG